MIGEVKSKGIVLTLELSAEEMKSLSTLIQAGIRAIPNPLAVTQRTAGDMLRFLDGATK